MQAGRWPAGAALSLLVLVGCATTGGEQMAPKSQSLYERLGGKPAITAVVDDFVARAATDIRINGYFTNANIPRLKAQLANQICEASGGPCTYTGPDMKTLHRGMGITNADFSALVEDLVASLDTFRVPTREKQDLLALLEPLRGDIVER
jgi:hemoglobin